MIYSHQWHGLVYIALGAVLLLSFGHALLHLLLGLIGLYLIFNGISLFRGSQSLGVRFSYWKSRFFK